MGPSPSAHLPPPGVSSPPPPPVVGLLVVVIVTKPPPPPPPPSEKVFFLKLITIPNSLSPLSKLIGTLNSVCLVAINLIVLLTGFSGFGCRGSRDCYGRFEGGRRWRPSLATQNSVDRRQERVISVAAASCGVVGLIHIFTVLSRRRATRHLAGLSRWSVYSSVPDSVTLYMSKNRYR